MKTTRQSWKNPNHPKPKLKLLHAFTRRAAALAKLPDFDWELEIQFVDDAAMARYNEELVGHTGTTDVITFSYFDADFPPEPGETGVELIVNPDAAAREGAKRKNSSYARELALYVVHGLLHAAGEDDLEPVARRRMRRREREVMSALAPEFDFAAIFP